MNPFQIFTEVELIFRLSNGVPDYLRNKELSAVFSRKILRRVMYSFMPECRNKFEAKRQQFGVQQGACFRYTNNLELTCSEVTWGALIKGRCSMIVK